MGLFDQVLNAIEDPQRQGNSNQLGQIVSAMSQMSQQTHTNPDTMQQAVAIVGSFLKPSLQETRRTQGEAAAEQMVERGSQAGGATAILSQLLNPQQQQKLVQTLENRTGLNGSQVQSLLPVLIPIVMNLLKTGSSTQPGQANNSVLNAFLDADGDGDVDMSDMLNAARRFA